MGHAATIEVPSGSATTELKRTSSAKIVTQDVPTATLQIHSGNHNVTVTTQTRSTTVQLAQPTKQVATVKKANTVSVVSTAVTAVGFGGDKNYVHDQGTAASSWTVTHNLGKRPAVTVVDSSGQEVEATVSHVDENSLTINLGYAFSGKAFIN